MSIEHLSGDIRFHSLNTIENGYWAGDEVRRPFVIQVGNTGLKLVATKIDDDPYTWEMHYTPEGALEKVDGYEHKFGSIFPFALHELITWRDAVREQAGAWHSQHSSAFAPDPVPQVPSQVFIHTNETMTGYVERLLGPDIVTRSSVAPYFSDERVISLEGLEKNDDLREVLASLHATCQQEEFVMEPGLHSHTIVHFK